MRSKKLWISVISVVVCLAVIIGVCLAVFLPAEEGDHIVIEKPQPPTDTETPRGELEIKLVRERLDYTILDKRGCLYEDNDPKSIDFSKSKDNIFGLSPDMLVGPGCYFSADMVIENTKGYAFEYWLEITPEDGEHLLADQLELTVTVGEKVIVQPLGEGLLTKTLATVGKGDVSRFTVKIEYLNVEENDKTQNSTLAFDMAVHARLV